MPAYVVPTNENLMIARHTLAALAWLRRASMAEAKRQTGVSRRS